MSATGTVAEAPFKVAFGKLAEVLAEHLTKGRQIAVEGSLRQDTWADATTGERRCRVQVVARRVQFLGTPRREQPDVEPSCETEADPADTGEEPF
jgi:single-strand DNA-binding protein